MIVEPLTRPPDTAVRLPGSKSLTNRALVVAAVAEGTSTLVGGLVADDTSAMVDAVRAIGAGVDAGRDAWTVRGIAGAAARRDVVIHAHQAGTVARFLPPVVAAVGGSAVVDADPQMRSRPMAPLLAALRRLGATVEERGEPGHLPILVRGPLTSGTTELPGDVSSQFLSGLLLAGPLLAGGIEIRLTTPLVSRPYAAMTVAVLDSFGAHADVGVDRCTVQPGGLRATEFTVEPDASAASYFLAAAAITGGRVTVPGLGRESVQGDVAFADVLEKMGASVSIDAGSIEVRGGDLHGVDVDLADLSDTVPTFAVVAAFADSPSRVRGVGFVRGKESDRIGAVVHELRRCGVDADEEADGFVVRPSAMHGATVDPHGDHRLAMAFALAGLRVPGIDIDDPGCVAKTFPEYFNVLEGLRG